ncbi:MAG: hypothetical protein K9M10_02405 [Candidatus Pacebacteria bacterium]|nr:hypothetical protein [Candidatus Paceibacterota bacterium]
MMSFTTNNRVNNFEEDEDEASGIDDALLGELDDSLSEEDSDLGDVSSPLIKKDEFDLEEDEEDDLLKEDASKLFDDEEEEDMDYDSFDDHDEM